MEQLGPFHLFYTLSCAEMRWPSVLAEVLRTLEKDKIKICYPEDWDGNAESIIIKTSHEVETAIFNFWQKKQKHLNQPDVTEQHVNLAVYRDWYLAQKKISMTDFLKDHFILITRIFDKRVKDFHTEVMNKKGIVNYCYRVEFQMRGLPHIHGVAWLDQSKIKDCVDENGLFKEDKSGEASIIKLIDGWTKCSLQFGHKNQKTDILNLINEIDKKKVNINTTNSEIQELDCQIKLKQLQKATLIKESKNVKKKTKQNLKDSELMNQIKSLKKEKNHLEKRMGELQESLNENLQLKKEKELCQLVQDVNMHHHTRSCKKYGNDCR